MELEKLKAQVLELRKRAERYDGGTRLYSMATDEYFTLLFSMFDTMQDKALSDEDMAAKLKALGLVSAQKFFDRAAEWSGDLLRQATAREN